MSARHAGLQIVIRRAGPWLRRTQWYFYILAENGNVLAHSETYHNRGDAVSAARAIIDAGERGAIELDDTA